MKHSLILKQHVPYAAMICKALDFCEIMLAHTNTHTIYPFAALTMHNDMQCIFTPLTSQHASAGMIEELEMRISQFQLYAESSVSMLVYSAKISPHSYSASTDPATEEETDALVFNITDTAGKNNVTIYPYSVTRNGIRIETPYTCDFSD